MAVNKLELKLELKLSRMAMFSIAETIWLLPSIADCVLQHQLSPAFDAKRLCYKQPINFKIWETVIEKVHERTELLPLPWKVKVELNEVVALAGERIRMSYICRISKDVNHWRRHSINNFFVGTIRKYPSKSCNYFQSVKIEKFLSKREFFDSICRKNFRIDQVCNHKNEIIAYLDCYQQPGLGASIKNKNDIIFNIICIWNFIHVKLHVPKKYLKNHDYIIPLEQVLKLCNELTLRGESFPVNYFIAKLNFLGVPNLSHIVKIMLLTALQNSDSRFCPIFGYDIADRFLLSINALPPNEVLKFFKININEIILFLLPLWPYQELIPQILDFFFENELNLKCRFLLQFLIYRIGLENNRKHQTINKDVYLRSIEKIWSKASKSEKQSIKVLSLLKLNEVAKNEIVLGNIDIDKHKKLMEKGNMEFLTNFVSNVVVSEDDFEQFCWDCKILKKVDLYPASMCAL